MSIGDNGKKPSIEKALGLDTPFDEALHKFINISKEELADAAASGDGDPIAEGATEIVPFKGTRIRKAFHNGEWYFSIIDICEALTDSTNPRRYWSDLKRQIIEIEGHSEMYDEIVQLTMPGADGKMYKTDAANPEALFRIIQSIPSAKAERFKRWFAKVAYERIQEIQNPEIAIKRAMLIYQLQGRPNSWVEKRVRSIFVRKELTTEWKKRGVTEENEFAILTGVLSTHTFGMGVADYRKMKGLGRNHNLRDHMTDLELIFTMLGEKSTKEIAEIRNAQGFEQNKNAARAGGTVAGNARKGLERETGRPVISKSNFLKSADEPEEIEDQT